jgi:hypothetical protein
MRANEKKGRKPPCPPCPCSTDPMYLPDGCSACVADIVRIGEELRERAVKPDAIGRFSFADLGFPKEATVDDVYAAGFEIDLRPRKKEGAVFERMFLCHGYAVPEGEKCPACAFRGPL